MHLRPLVEDILTEYGPLGILDFGDPRSVTEAKMFKDDETTVHHQMTYYFGKKVM